jgi:hypothetical protein
MVKYSSGKGAIIVLIISLSLLPQSAAVQSQPNWAIQVYVSNGAMLSSLKVGFSVLDNMLTKVDVLIGYVSKDQPSNVSVFVLGGGPTLYKPTPAAIYVSGFMLGDEFFPFSLGHPDAHASPVVFDNTIQFLRARYSVDLNSVINASIRKFLSITVINFPINNITTLGSIGINFSLLNAIGEIGGIQFERAVLSSNTISPFFKNDPIAFALEVTTTHALTAAKANDSDMTLLSPFQAQYTFPTFPSVLGVYVAWNLPSPWWTTIPQPWDWIISAIVGGLITMIGGFLKRRITHRRKRK